MTSVSVAMCTYNGAKFIQEQLNSIARQTRKPDELIICDDASDDETVVLLYTFAELSDIKTHIYINKTNMGYTRNFEQALGLCSGDLVFIADQDDIWYPEKVETVCGIFMSHPDILGVTHEGRLVDTSGRWYGTYKNKQIASGYGRNHRAITGALSCIKKSALKYLIPFPPVTGHDTWLSYFFSCFPKLWFFSDICLEDIRRHDNNTSEWVVNSFRPVNRIDVFRLQLSTDIANDYSDRLTMNQSLMERLKKYFQELDTLSQKNVNKCIIKLDAEYHAIVRRQAIASESNRLIRWYRACQLLTTGGYTYFNHWRSFFRDIIR